MTLATGWTGWKTPGDDRWTQDVEIRSPRAFTIDIAGTNGLSLVVRGGQVLSAGVWTTVNPATVALTDNTTNLIEVTAAGVVSRVGSLSAESTPLYLVTCSGGRVVRVDDLRPFASNTLPNWLANHPDAPPGVSNAKDDEFDDTPGQSGPSNGLDAKWSWVNQGTSTLAFAKGSAIMSGQDDGINKARYIAQTVPVGNWKFRTKLQLSANTDSTAGAGIVVSAGTGATDNLVIFNLILQDAAAFITADRWDDYNTVGTALANFDAMFEWVCYLEVEYDGTNLLCRYSRSGVEGSYLLVVTEAVATHLGTPTHIGLYSRNTAVTPASVAVFDWFRRVA